MADKKISDLTTASEIKNEDNIELSQSTGGGLVSLKATILALATKIATNINFTSALQTNSKTLTGAINEVAQGGGGGGSSTLAGLSDVDIDDQTLVDGQILAFNGTSEKWENGTGGGGSSWTDVTGTLSSGATSITLSHGSITTNSTIDFYTSIFGVNPTAVSVSTGSVTLTFEAQSSDLGVKIRVTNDALVQYNLIPRMSGNTDTTGTASASYVYSGRYAYYGFTTDGNGSLGTATSFWYNNAASNYLQYVFNSAKHISKIGFGALESSSINLTFKFQFTTDGINWTDGDTNTITTNDWTWYELSDTVECLGFRIYCIGNISTISGVQAYGWE